MSLKTEKSSSLVLHKTLVFFGMKHLWLDQIEDEDEFSIGNIQSFACRHLLLPHTFTWFNLIQGVMGNIPGTN